MNTPERTTVHISAQTDVMNGDENIQEKQQMTAIRYQELTAKKPAYQCFGYKVLAESTADESPCLLKYHTLYRYRRPAGDFNAQDWQAKHNSVINQFRVMLNERYPNSLTRTEVKVREDVVLKKAKLFGSADLVVIHDDGSWTVGDAKSGSLKNWHWVQTALYAWFFNYQRQAPAIRSIALCYNNTQDADGVLSHEEMLWEEAEANILTTEVKERIRTVAATAQTTQAPESHPSAQNCRYCPWREVCRDCFSCDAGTSDAADASDAF